MPAEQISTETGTSPTITRSLSTSGKGKRMDYVTTVDRHLESDTLSVATAILTIIIPTLNERDNIDPLVRLLTATLPNTAWEAIFVDDDSRDGTAEHVRALARRNPRVRSLQRIGRRGLTTACMEGVLASASPYVAVMDADLQHDERLLPQMLDALDSGAVDLVVGSRYVTGGDIGDWSGSRARISGLATRLARMADRVARRTATATGVLHTVTATAATEASVVSAGSVAAVRAAGCARSASRRCRRSTTRTSAASAGISASAARSIRAARAAPARSTSAC